MNNGEFSKSIVIILSKRAGSHCSLCKKLTSIPHRNPDKFHNLGEAAHIFGQKSAPNLRFNPDYTPQQLSSASNGIWLCPSCHHIVDNDEITYTVQVLQDLKAAHDKLITNLFESGSRLAPALESKQLEMEGLKFLIKSKELLLSERDQLYNQEVNQLRFKLATLQTEASFLADQLTKIKTEIIGLNHVQLESELLKGGDIDAALSVLDEETLNMSQIKLGKARLLKARLYLAKGDDTNAYQNFEEALRLWPSFYVASEYIQVLYYHKLDYNEVIRVANEVLRKEDNPRLIIELKGHLAQAQLKSGRFQEGHDTLVSALKLLNQQKEIDQTFHLIQAARLEKHLGDSCKHIGELSKALKCYERALNYYFQATIRDDKYGTKTEFAGLATAIGLLYQQNNNETEGLVHHLRAKEVLKNITDEDNIRALIFLNIASCYLEKKTFSLYEAKFHVTAAIKILKKVSKTNPTRNLEYLSGAICQLADIYQALNPKYCTRYYQQALEIATMLSKINSIYRAEIYRIQHNYAVYLITSKKDLEKGMIILDKGLENLRATPSGVPQIEEQISRTLFFKLSLTRTRDEAMKILTEIIETNKNVNTNNKSYLYKLRAEQLLSEVNIQ